MSSLNRPTAIGVAVLEWELSDDDFSEQYADSWESCLGLPYRAFAFIPNSGGDSVAKIDLCAAEVQNTMQAGNPYVITHIPVGKMPVDVAVSLDRRQSRVLVANSGEASLSIIDSYTGRTLPFNAELKGQPGRLVMAPDPSVSEGMALVTLPMFGDIAVVRKGSDEEGNERWAVERTLSLQVDGYDAPKLGALELSPNGTTLYVTDMVASYFYILDLTRPDTPPVLRNVNGPQRNVSVSPDGRWVYLSKLDTRRVAVYDTVEDRYVDTNEELLSHRNNPPPSDLVDYDIDLQSYPRQVVFADVAKTVVTEPQDEDGDEGQTDGDIELDGDAELEEGEGEEASEDSEDEKEDDPLRLMKLRADDDDDLDGDVEEEETEAGTASDPRLFAYTIGYNGSIQLIDLEKNLHEPYDSTGGNNPSLSLVVNDELEIDNGQCLADIEWDLPVNSTPDALWEFVWQGVITQDDGSISGALDTENNRLYDSNVRFTDYSDLHARSSILPGDWIVITTSVLHHSDGSSFCMETVTDEEGNSTLQDVEQVRLEITAVTEEYLEFDPRSLNLEQCFRGGVSYVLRANNNYLVYMTDLDSQNVPISDRMYQGRAQNSDFVPSTVVESQEQFDMLAFQTEDYTSYICLQEVEDEETGETERIYRFRTNMTLAPSGEVVQGMRCRAPWLDAGEGIQASFENELIRVAICQDLDNAGIKTKRLDSYTYSFVTKSGVNEIVSITLDGVVDTKVGVLLEDAVVSEAYEDFPRLYVVDSSEGIVWVIDLLTDTVVDSIY